MCVVLTIAWIHLAHNVVQGRYDTAMLAYKKGRYMVDGGRPQTLLGLAPTAQTTPLQEEQSKRIYNKVSSALSPLLKLFLFIKAISQVWTQVQKIMNDLKLQLNTKLSEARLAPEEVDKTIEYAHLCLCMRAWLIFSFSTSQFPIGTRS